MSEMDWTLLLPELLLTALAFLVLGMDLVWRRQRPIALAALSAGGLVLTGLALLPLLGREGALFNRAFVVDGYALLFAFVFVGIALVVVLFSAEYVARFLAYPAEYYGLVLFSTVGMLFIGSAAELLTAYIALELLSFSLYVLAGYAREDPRSNEAGVKYILLGAFSSALLLFGIGLLYGYAGTTFYRGIAEAIAQASAPPLGLWMGTGFLLAGLGFKVAAVPFHAWAPDVYQGAPLPVTAYISTASKAAGFAFLVRLAVEALGPAAPSVKATMALIAALSMTLGNLVALRQSNMKRLLAYSSIGQVGYLLLGLAALTPVAIAGLLFHLIGYTVNNLAAFLGLIVAYQHTQREEMGDLAGLAEHAPLAALVLASALFSLAGLPVFVGFVTKFYLFTAAGQLGAMPGDLWLIGLAVLNSFISLYYYLMAIKEMYLSPPKPLAVPAVGEPSAVVPIAGGSHEAAHDGATVERWRVSPLLTVLLLVLFAAMVGLGVYPGPLVGAIEDVAQGLLEGGLPEAG
jgi:NADH-quinone oxidoreductase subunit N